MENVDISKLETINVGIVGHIDHGKTTILQKLSGKWADTHSEELKRGITIKLGYADAIIREENGQLTVNKNSTGTPKRYVTFVDAPGHEMLMATMLSGSAIMDAAILVIAANEGIKPQTQEHLVALKAKNIKNIIVVQNKIDLVSKERAMSSYKEIKKFLQDSKDSIPIIPVSATQGVNLDKILEELLKIEIKKPEDSVDPLFLVARSFDINKPGTKIENLHGGILGGALKQGILNVGDTIEVKPGYSYKKGNQYYYKSIKSKIVSLQKGEHKITRALSGGSLAIETQLDPSLTKADSLSGGVASIEGKLPEISDEIKIKYHLFDKIFATGQNEKISEIKNDEMLMLSMNTSITVGQVFNSKKEEFEVSLKIPVVPLKGESIGIARNFNGHWRLIGFGKII